MALSSSKETKVMTGIFQDLPITPHATTSKIVENNERLRHVVFAMDAGCDMKEHASPRAVVVTLLQGVMDFWIGAEKSVLRAGDVIYLAPGEPHSLKAVEPCYMALTLVDVAHFPAAQAQED